MELNYLTQELKNKYMTDLTSEDAEIDIDIQQYIDTINYFPFICTTQCCQGHPNDGYLSVIINEDISSWFEKELIVEMMIYCEDIYKYFEKLGDIIITRYIFRFNDYEKFFKILIKNLSTFQWIGVQ